MSIEAMKQALEALEYLATQIKPDYEHSKAITSLRQAIEQAENQEPVAWETRERFYEALDRAVEKVRQEMRVKTVTMRCKDYHLALPIVDFYGGHVLVGQVTPPAAQQEPVAWVEQDAIDWLARDERGRDAYTNAALYKQKDKWAPVPLYITPQPQREWVGLTQQDIDIAFDDTQEGGGFNEFARVIEQTLRSKNT